MAGSTVNLSLLARGVGEVVHNGHEKIDVKLEPEVRFTCFHILFKMCGKCRPTEYTVSNLELAILYHSLAICLIYLLL